LQLGFYIRDFKISLPANSDSLRGSLQIQRIDMSVDRASATRGIEILTRPPARQNRTQEPIKATVVLHLAAWDWMYTQSQQQCELTPGIMIATPPLIAFGWSLFFNCLRSLRMSSQGCSQAYPPHLPLGHPQKWDTCFVRHRLRAAEQHVFLSHLRLPIASVALRLHTGS
jgi:hypothetical protein